MRKVLSALLFVAIVFCQTTRSEEIQLKDGTRITGKLIGVTGDMLQIKTTYGAIQVPRADVISINFPENQTKQTVNETPAGPPRPVDETLSDGRYVNRSGGFTVQVPENWQLASHVLAQTPALIAALESPDATQLFVVTPEKFAGNLNTYRILVETQIKSSFSDYQQLEQNDVQLDGQKGIRMVAMATKKDTATPFKFLIYVVPYDGRVVRLTFFTLAPLYDDASPVFEKIAASYHSLPK
jgi:hypothetical protein